MKKLLFATVLLSFFATACTFHSDEVVAEACGKKLYRSEVAAQLPDGFSKEDSADFAQRYIENWTIEQLLVEEAKHALTFREQNFDKELTQFRNELLINAYYEKLTRDTALFPVSNEEVAAFMKESGLYSPIEKEIVRLNYVKLSKKSKILPSVKAILFDEAKRITEKSELEALCADSIEYFIEDDRWLYLEDLEMEIPLQLSAQTQWQNEAQCVESTNAQYHYLIVILDYHTQFDHHEQTQNAQIRQMIRQQKKSQFLQQKRKSML